MLYQNEVGSSLYVWSERSGRPSKRKAVISAHGGPAKINGMAEAPFCRLVFYSPHGRPLGDPKLENMIARMMQSYETLTSRNSQDYELGKYTNTGAKPKHNEAGETYDLVAGMDKLFRTKHKVYGDNLAMLDGMPNKSADVLTLARVQAALETRYRELPMDIVTIRNRVLLKDPCLSSVLTELWDKGYKYDEIHCNFCRGLDDQYNAPKVDLSA